MHSMGVLRGGGGMADDILPHKATNLVVFCYSLSIVVVVHRSVCARAVPVALCADKNVTSSVALLFTRLFRSQRLC